MKLDPEQLIQQKASTAGEKRLELKTLPAQNGRISLYLTSSAAQPIPTGPMKVKGALAKGAEDIMDLVWLLAHPILLLEQDLLDHGAMDPGLLPMDSGE